MTSILVTQILCISVFFLAIIYDIVIVFIDKGATISKIILGASMHHPSIALIVGVLMGHLFWPMYGAGEVEYWKYSVWGLLILIVCAITLDLLDFIPPHLVTTIFWFGIILGYVFWPQRYPGS